MKMRDVTTKEFQAEFQSRCRDLSRQLFTLEADGDGMMAVLWAACMAMANPAINHPALTCVKHNLNEILIPKLIVELSGNDGVLRRGFEAMQAEARQARTP
jgi:hypothetical protein